MKIVERVFKSREEMAKEMQLLANAWEGQVPGRHGYNFPNKDGSYTIAYLKNDLLTKRHEMSHAQFFFSQDWRDKILQEWNNLTTEEQTVVTKFLTRCGYKTEHHLDEFGAYWTTERWPRKYFGLKKI